MFVVIFILIVGVVHRFVNIFIKIMNDYLKIILLLNILNFNQNKTIMKFKLLSIALIAITSVAFAQNRNAVWNATTKKANMIALESRMQLPENHLFDLNLNVLKQSIVNTPKRDARNSSIIISVPNAEGILENFKIQQNYEV